MQGLRNRVILYLTWKRWSPQADAGTGRVCGWLQTTLGLSVARQHGRQITGCGQPMWASTDRIAESLMSRTQTPNSPSAQFSLRFVGCSVPFSGRSNYPIGIARVHCTRLQPHWITAASASRKDLSFSIQSHRTRAVVVAAGMVGTVQSSPCSGRLAGSAPLTTSHINPSGSMTATLLDQVMNLSCHQFVKWCTPPNPYRFPIKQTKHHFPVYAFQTTTSDTTSTKQTEKHQQDCHWRHFPLLRYFWVLWGDYLLVTKYARNTHSIANCQIECVCVKEIDRQTDWKERYYEPNILRSLNSVPCP